MPRPASARAPSPPLNAIDIESSPSSTRACSVLKIPVIATSWYGCCGMDRPTYRLRRTCVHRAVQGYVPRHEVLHDLRGPGRVRHARRGTRRHPQLRRTGGVRGGGGLRRHLGGRAPLAHRVLAHERAGDLPHRGGGEDVAHPRRARRGVHAVRVQPPGARRRAGRDARHHLRRPPQPRRRARRHGAGDVVVRRRPRAHHAAGEGGAARSSVTAGARTPSSGTPTC